MFIIIMTITIVNSRAPIIRSSSSSRSSSHGSTVIICISFFFGGGGGTGNVSELCRPMFVHVRPEVRYCRRKKALPKRRQAVIMPETKKITACELHVSVALLCK